MRPNPNVDKPLLDVQLFQPCLEPISEPLNSQHVDEVQVRIITHALCGRHETKHFEREIRQHVQFELTGKVVFPDLLQVGHFVAGISQVGHVKLQVNLYKKPIM